MKIKCVSISILEKDLSKSTFVGGILPMRAPMQKCDFSLLVGKEYFVHGMTINTGYIWYYICDEDFVYYPVWNPSSLFEITDGSIPSFWEVGFQELGYDLERMFLISFPEWVRDRFFMIN